MAREVYLLVGVLVIAAAYFVYRFNQVVRFRGKMLVTCPETGKPAAVKIATWRATVASVVGRRNLELSNCSRWPERGDCGQECLCQVIADPENHRVWAIAAKWFEGKKCAYCRKPIEKVSHLDRRPALLDAEKKTVEWDHIPAEKLPEAMWGCLPVCWSCHMTETFLREHGDRVVWRPWKRSGPLGEYVPEGQDYHQGPTDPPVA
jgi:hypothetical protein